MERVYITGACRTPIGKVGGGLAEYSVVDLARIVLLESIRRANIDKTNVEHIIVGCALQAGAGQNIARQVALRAGLPYSTTGETVNVVCGSGMEAINLAARMVKSGIMDVVVAIGAESMSNVPYYTFDNTDINSLRNMIIDDALIDPVGNYTMGITAERIAEEWHVTREEADRFAYNSHRKANIAVSQGFFDKEIIPVYSSRKNKKIVVDEAIRFNPSLLEMQKLRPVFMENGVLTAGNSCGINDGAAAVVLLSDKAVKENNVIPDAEWMGGSLVGIDPSIMGMASVYSTQKILQELELKNDDIDLVEINEAFSTQVIAVQRELGIRSEILNIYGGALALGHPLGMSGCRIVVSLLNSLKQTGRRTGLATICIGGGLGATIVLRMIE